MTFAVPMVGASKTQRTDLPLFKVGTSQIDDANRNWVYVGPAAGAIAANAVVVVNGSFGVTTGAGAHTADAAFTSGEFGWVRRTTSSLA